MTLTDQGSGCPCVVLPLEERCHPRCTCGFSGISVGCRYCARYGSMEQRLARARRIAQAVEKEEAEHDNG